MTRRTEKVSALLQKEIAQYLSRVELNSLTTVSKVKVSPDLKWAKAAITVMDTEEQQQQTIERLRLELPELQQELNRKLKMKFVPRVSFVLDQAEEYASRINELIRKTHE